MALYSDTAATSDSNLDKIIQEDTLSYTIAGSNNYVVLNSELKTAPNTAGQKGFLTVSFSVDDVNFYDQGTDIYYNAGALNPQVVSFRVQAGNDNGNIYFLLTNGLQTSSNVPIDQTVTINYSLFTLE